MTNHASAGNRHGTLTTAQWPTTDGSCQPRGPGGRYRVMRELAGQEVRREAAMTAQLLAPLIPSSTVPAGRQRQGAYSLAVVDQAIRAHGRVPTGARRTAAASQQAAVDAALLVLKSMSLSLEDLTAAPQQRALPRRSPSTSRSRPPRGPRQPLALWLCRRDGALSCPCPASSAAVRRSGDCAARAANRRRICSPRT
jgi:hypothetical protein